MRRTRSKAAAVLLFALLIGALGAPPAGADFGFKHLSSTFTGAEGVQGRLVSGTHPDAWQTTIDFNTSGPPGEEHPEGSLRNLSITLPAGLVGTPGLVPSCSLDDFLDEACAPSTQVGTLLLTTSIPDLPPLEVYLLDAPRGTVARIGFHAEKIPTWFDLHISPEPPYNLVASLTNASQVAELYGAALTLFGSPGGIPFLTLPRSCEGGLDTAFSATPWQPPGTAVSATAPGAQTLEECASLAYNPILSVAPTTTEAAAPSGLDLDLSAPDPGITSLAARAAADTVGLTLDLPPGLALNPPAAAGLSACSRDQLAGELADTDPATGCPQSSKLGTGTVTTPLLDGEIAGAIYAAEPDDPATRVPGAENPFDTLLALYLVLRDPERGLVFTVPVGLEADQGSGQLHASVRQIPELPISHLSLRFYSGPRAPLSTPPDCGRHRISFALIPSSGNPALAGSDPFAVDSGCPSGFEPTLVAGATSSAAAASAPLVLDVGNDGGSNLAGLDFTLPAGLAASFDSIETCPEAAVRIASCPPGSRLGYAELALGSGPSPLWVPGRREGAEVFLAGPYGGAPYSLLVRVPANVGPYDLGTVAVRAKIEIDPVTARAILHVDRLPQIMEGIPLRYRRLRLVLDRPGFLRNPTSCSPKQIRAVATSADGTSAHLASPFQAAGCEALPFKPALALRLTGGLGRNGHPSLRALLRARGGDAGLAAVSFELLPNQLLDLQRLRALCGDRLPPDLCPPGSRLGQARLWSPALDEPLRGSIFVRRPAHGLPDLLVDLHGGGIDIRLRGHVAARNGRLRVSLPALPDVPLSRALIRLDGGRDGILVNSASICAGPRRVTVGFRAHNGKRRAAHSRVRARC